MEPISTSSLGKILKWLLIFIFIFGVIFTPFCHWFIYKFGEELFNLPSMSTDPIMSAVRGGYHGASEYKFIIAEVYTLGIAMLGIVIQLIRICLCIEKNNPFDYATAKALKIMAVLSLLLVIIYTVKMVVFPSVPSLVVIMTFIIIGLISFVFSQLFKKAAQYKEENDFTI